jgi:hypothetical protein
MNIPPPKRNPRARDTPPSKYHITHTVVLTPNDARLPARLTPPARGLSGTLLLSARNEQVQYTRAVAQTAVDMHACMHATACLPDLLRLRNMWAQNFQNPDANLARRRSRAWQAGFPRPPSYGWLFWDADLCVRIRWRRIQSMWYCGLFSCLLFTFDGIGGEIICLIVSVFEGGHGWAKTKTRRSVKFNERRLGFYFKRVRAVGCVGLPVANARVPPHCAQPFYTA